MGKLTLSDLISYLLRFVWFVVEPIFECSLCLLIRFCEQLLQLRLNTQVIYLRQALEVSLQLLHVSRLSIKNVWHGHSQPIVRFNQNFSISQCNKNLNKITYIKEFKNIYFA